jgi:hypothetical protein
MPNASAEQIYCFGPSTIHKLQPQPSIINGKTIADFTRVVEQTEILEVIPSGPWMRRRRNATNRG